MSGDEKKKLDELVKKFQAIENFEERCRFFHKPENAALKIIFHLHHFPNPDLTASVPPSTSGGASQAANNEAPQTEAPKTA